MKKYISILLMSVLTLLMTCSTAFAAPDVQAKSNTAPTKDLLLITENQAEYDLSFINQNPDLVVDIVELDNIKGYNADDYYEIAAPITLSDQLTPLLREAYTDEKKVYLYGELTIEQYKDVLNLDKYGVDVSIEVNDAKTGMKQNKPAFMTFSDEYISDKIQNVVALRENDTNGLLATVPKNDDGSYNTSLLMKAVIDDVIPHTQFGTSATLVDSDYDITTYDYLGNYAVLDWRLYQESDSDPDYDYFAIRTNVSCEGSYFEGTEIWVNDDLAYPADEYIDSDPGDSTETTSFSVSLDFGEEISGGISWDFEFDNAPEVDRTVSLSSDYAHWTCIEDLYGLGGEVFSPGMSWASTGTLAGIDLEFRGYFYNSQLAEGQYTDWGSVEVRYNY